MMAKMVRGEGADKMHASDFHMTEEYSEQGSELEAVRGKPKEKRLNIFDRDSSDNSVQVDPPSRAASPSPPYRAKGNQNVFGSLKRRQEASSGSPQTQTKSVRFN